MLPGQNPLLRENGDAREISKIEIEILENGNCRWILWEGAERVYVAVAHPRDFDHLLKGTSMVMNAMAGIRPEIGA